jgi:hypothetical protein
VGAGGALALFARQLAGIGGLFTFLRPLSGWAGLVVTLVASNENLRNSFMQLFTQVAKVAGMIMAAAAPAFEAINEALKQPEIPELVSAISELVAKVGLLAAGLVSALAGGIQPFLDTAVKLAGVLADVIGWVTQNEAAFTALMIAIGGYMVIDRANMVLVKLIDSFTKAAGSARGFGAALTALGGPATILLGVSAALGAGIVWWMNKSQDSVRKTREEFASMIDNIEKSDGHINAMARAEHEIRMIRQVAAERKAAGEKVKGEGGVGIGTLGSAMAAAQGMTQEEAARLQEAYRQMSEHAAAAVEELRGPTAEISAFMKKSAEDVSSSLEVIDKALGISAMTWVDQTQLTSQQAKMLEDRITELVQSSQSWVKDMTSFSGALLREEQMDMDKLLRHYDEMKRRIEYFWADLAFLQAMGLSDAAVTDLIEKGPMAVGDALGTLVQEASAKGHEATQGFISQINAGAAAMQEFSSNATKKMAENMLMSGGLLKAQTAAEQEAVVKGMQEVRSKMNEGVQTVQAGLETIGVYFRGASQGLGEEYIAAVRDFLQKLNSGTATAEEIGAAYVKALNIGQTLAATAPSEMAAGAVKLVNTGLTSLRSGQQQMYNAGQSLGIDVGKGLASSSDLSGAAGKLHALKAIRGIMGQMGQAFAGMARQAGGGLGGNLAKALFQGLSAATGTRMGGFVDAAIKEQQEAIRAAEAKATPGIIPQGPRAPTKQSMEDSVKAAKKAKDDQKAIDDAVQNVLDSIKPIEIWGQALDNVAGHFMQFLSLTDKTADGIESMGKSFIGLARSTDSHASKMRQVRATVQGLIAGLREETEAAARAGVIHEDAGSMTDYLRGRMSALRSETQDLARSIRDGAGAFITLDERIQLVRDSLDKLINTPMAAEEAAFNREDAFDKLEQRIKDQRSLLTGFMLTERDRGKIIRDTRRDLFAYIKAVQEEATAMAKAGRIGADAGSIQKYIQERLQPLKTLFPEVAAEVEGYVANLEQVPKDTETNVQVYVDEALRQIDQYANRLGGVVGEYNSIINVMVNDAKLQALKDAIEDIAESDVTPSLIPSGLGDFASDAGSGNLPEQILSSLLRGSATRIGDAVRKGLGNINIGIGAEDKASSTIRDIARTAAENLGERTLRIFGRDNASEVIGGVSGYAGRALGDKILQIYSRENGVYTNLYGVWDYALRATSDKVMRVLSDPNQAYGALYGVWDYANRATGTKVMNVLVETAQAYQALYGIWNYAVNSVAVGIANGLRNVFNRDTGGPIPPGASVVQNNTGKAEWILNPSQMEALQDLVGANSMGDAVRSMMSGKGKRPKLFDSGGPLPTGVTMVMNKTGRSEQVLTADDYRLLLQAAAGGTGRERTVVEHMSVTTDQPPSAFLDEGLYRALNRANS